MEIFVVVAIIAALLYYFLVVKKVKNLNDDPAQKELANLLAQGGRGEATIGNLINFISGNGWKSSEVRTRIPHALSITKLMCSPDEYEMAVRLGKSIATTYED